MVNRDGLVGKMVAMYGRCSCHACSEFGRATRVGRRGAAEFEQGDGAVRELLCCVLEEVEVEEGQRRKRKDERRGSKKEREEQKERDRRVFDWSVSCTKKTVICLSHL